MSTTTTKKEYKTEFNGYSIVIPKGSIVTNQTACGIDENYHFWQDFDKIAEMLTGFKNSFLAHNLTYYGINIPSKYCKEYNK